MICLSKMPITYKGLKFDEMTKEMIFEFIRDQQRDLCGKISLLETRSEKLEKCVEFYADKESWAISCSLFKDSKSIVKFDNDMVDKNKNLINSPLGMHYWLGGSAARKCLKELKK